MFKNYLKFIFFIIFRPFIKLYLKKSLTVFCFHDVTNNPSFFSREYELNIETKIFEKQILFIKKNFNIINPKDLFNEKLPNNAALITFDDGFVSYLNEAYPIMKKYNVPSINFLNCEVSNGKDNFAVISCLLSKYDNEFIKTLKLKNTNMNKNIPLHLYCTKEIVDNHLKSYSNKIKKYSNVNFATLDQLNNYSKNELIDYGNHLYNHYVCLLLKNSELINYYNKNQNILKSFNNSLDFFAFPHGLPDISFNLEQIKIIKSLGAKKIFSTNKLINFDNKNSYMHRIALVSSNKSSYNLWFLIIRSALNTFKEKNI